MCALALQRHGLGWVAEIEDQQGWAAVICLISLLRIAMHHLRWFTQEFSYIFSLVITSNLAENLVLIS